MHEHRTARQREKPIDRAARLVAEDRVRHYDAEVYEVESDTVNSDGETRTYLVIASPTEGFRCHCEARTPLCAHVLAVAHVRQRDRAERVLANGSAVAA